jgi:hypothetical protein
MRRQSPFRKPGFRSFHELIVADFAARSEEDPSFSLRKYAAFLQVNDSSLSQFLRGKRKVSARLIQNAGRNLGLSREEIAHYIAFDQEEESSLGFAGADSFKSIRDWRPDAVLELLDGQPDTEESLLDAAKRLRLPIERVRAILDGLKAHEILKVENSIFKDQFQHVTRIASPMEEDDSGRSYQESVLRSSLASLRVVPIRDRNHTTLLLKINKDDLPSIIGLLKQGRRQIANEFQDPNDPNREIYALHVGLFPLAAYEEEEG